MHALPLSVLEYLAWLMWPMAIRVTAISGVYNTSFSMMLVTDSPFGTSNFRSPWPTALNKCLLVALMGLGRIVVKLVRRAQCRVMC